MNRPAPFLLLLGLALSGCQTPAPNAPSAGPAIVVEEPESWRGTATPAGEAAIEALDGRWAAALEESRRRGAGRTLAAEAPLLDPQVKLPRAAPAPGPYRCRLLRIGITGGRTRSVAPVKSGFCFVGVEGDQLSFTSDISGYRLGGYLYDAASSAQLVFLGASAPARGRAPGYGEEPAKDVAGRLERVDEFRYRLAIAGPAATELHVLELIPAPRS